MASPQGQDGFRMSSALAWIMRGAAKRSMRVVSRPLIRIFALHHILQQVPAVFAGYVSLNDNSSDPDYNSFVAEPVTDNPVSDAKKVLADVNNFVATNIYYNAWVERARQIRLSERREDCVGNLSVALNVGAAYAFGMSSANTVLSLIPTAGVLIGAPARELWVLYKLCPLAGMLSILLSLGGSIVPMEVNDYENIDKFQYQGMMPSARDFVQDERDPSTNKTEAQKFADQVLHRARSHTGGRPTHPIGLGILLQLSGIAAICVACWFLEGGAIIVWWCKESHWMFVWYGITAFSSILENFAGVPFTKTYTMRVWRAPRVVVDEDSPWVRNPSTDLSSPITEGNHMDEYQINLDDQYHASNPPQLGGLRRRPTASELQKETFDDPVKILNALETGYSNNAQIWMDHSKPYSQSNDAFYVLLSVKGVIRTHAALRIVSKVISIGVFAVGTTFFASAALITIMEALITAALILCAGIFGRVVAMWMASTMMRYKPVLHRVVSSQEEAGRYLQAIFQINEIACEVKGHVIVHGRCVKRFPHALRWSIIFGVLSKPFDLASMAVNLQSFQSQENQALLQDNYVTRV